MSLVRRVESGIGARVPERATARSAEWQAPEMQDRELHAAAAGVGEKRQVGGPAREVDMSSRRAEHRPRPVGDGREPGVVPHHARLRIRIADGHRGQLVTSRAEPIGEFLLEPFQQDIYRHRGVTGRVIRRLNHRTAVG